MLNPILKRKNLSHEEYARYARQIIIEEIKSEGQNKIKNAKVVCIGAGGLNSAALLYLVTCGVGTIGIVDNDTIELSNLQRQIIYQERDIGKDKAQMAVKNLGYLNSSIGIASYNQKLTPQNISEIISNYEIIIDGTDNFKTRYLISQYCYQLHKIHIYGAIEKFTGQVSVFNYQNNGNYYNLYSKISYARTKTCGEIGIINTLAGTIGLLQATEAIKIIVGIGKITTNNLAVFNLLNCSLNRSKIKPGKLINQEVVQNHQKYQKIKAKYISIKSISWPYKIIDIRTPAEFLLNQLEHAINIPLDTLKKSKSIQRIAKISDRYWLIVYCSTKRRSYVASQILQSHSIDHYIFDKAT